MRPLEPQPLGALEAPTGAYSDGGGAGTSMSIDAMEARLSFLTQYNQLRAQNSGSKNMNKAEVLELRKLRTERKKLSKSIKRIKRLALAASLPSFTPAAKPAQRHKGKESRAAAARAAEEGGAARPVGGPGPSVPESSSRGRASSGGSSLLDREVPF